jgi:hypothetical protein
MAPGVRPKRPSRAKAPTRPSAKKLSAASAVPSATETEAVVQLLIERIAPSHGRLFDALRRALRKRFVTAFELVYGYCDCVVVSFSPDEHGYHGIVAVRADAEAVRLYFNRGAELAGSTALLEGAGKTTRWMQVRAAAELNKPEVKRLITDAIALSDVRFSTNGKGAVIFRSGGSEPRPRGAKKR